MRPLHDDYFLNIAKVVATRATCLRRNVGCILINNHNHILATGYNGVAKGVKHCNYKSTISEVSLDIDNQYPYACRGAFTKSGVDLDQCEAIHAEQNALLQCRNTNDIFSCYVTVSPCILCTKMLMNTSCQNIIFLESYSHPEPASLWLRSSVKRTWVHHSM